MKAKKFFLGMLLGILPLAPGFIFAEDLAIIVNKENLIEDISFRELIKIFKNEKQYWDNGKAIYLVMQEAGRSEKEVVLKKIYKMNDEQLKKFWLGEIFQGRLSSIPKAFDSNESLRLFVVRVPGAIGFIRASAIDDSVKVLTIDKKHPKEDSYPLTE